MSLPKDFDVDVVRELASARANLMKVYLHANPFSEETPQPDDNVAAVVASVALAVAASAGNGMDPVSTIADALKLILSGAFTGKETNRNVH